MLIKGFLSTDDNRGAAFSAEVLHKGIVSKPSGHKHALRNNRRKRKVCDRCSNDRDAYNLRGKVNRTRQG